MSSSPNRDLLTDARSAPANGKAYGVLRMHVDPVDIDEAQATIMRWCAAGGPRMVCAANVHMTMLAWDDADFREIVNSADLVLPDGVPMVWSLRFLGAPVRRRVRVTLDLIDRLLASAASTGVPVGFYGGDPDSMPLIRGRLEGRFPGLDIRAMVVAPFHAPTPEEDAAAIEAIRASGARLLFIGVGCPKQERWMADHRESLDCVMMGVGAAFDVLAGRTREAPPWTRDIGLEWTYRLALEPGRLSRRYLRQNPRFVYHFGRECLASVVGRRNGTR